MSLSPVFVLVRLPPDHILPATPIPTAAPAAALILVFPFCASKNYPAAVFIRPTPFPFSFPRNSA